MRELALGVARHQRLGPGVQLEDAHLRPAVNQPGEAVHGQRVVEVHDELVVAVRDRHQTRQGPGRAQPLHGVVDARALRDHGLGRARALAAMLDLDRAYGSGQIGQILGLEPPACRAQHDAMPAHAGQEARMIQRPPGPRPAGAILPLQRAQEAVHADRAQVEVVRRGQPRDHLAIEAPRAQDDAISAHRDQQILHRDVLVGRRAGDAEERDLVLAQHRPAQDVAQPALVQVYDLGEDGVRTQRLLGAEMVAYELVQRGRGVTEAAQHARARGAAGAAQQHLELAARQRLGRRRHHRGHDREGVGERGRVVRGQRVHIRVGEHELVLAAGPDVLEPAQEPAMQLGERRALVRRRSRKGQVEQQRGARRAGIVAGLEADARLLVQDLDQRHLAILVALLKGATKPRQRVLGPGGQDAPEHLEAALQRLDDRGPQRGLGSGLDQVDLEQARAIDRHGQRLEALGDLLIHGPIPAHAAAIQVREPLGRVGQQSGDRGRGRDLGEDEDQRLDRLHPRDRRLELAHQELTIDQLVDERRGLFQQDLGVVGHERAGQIIERCAVACARQGGLDVWRAIDRHEVIGAQAAVEAGLGVAQPAAQRVQAAVGLPAQGRAQRRHLAQPAREREQIVVVEARAAAAGSAAGEHQIGALGDAAHGHAREQPERRGPGGHAREVAHQRALDLLAALAVGGAHPGVEIVGQPGRSHEQGLLHVVARDGLAQPIAHQRDILARGAVHAGAPGDEFVEGEQRRAQHEARIDAQGSRSIGRHGRLRGAGGYAIDHVDTAPAVRHRRDPLRLR